MSFDLMAYARQRRYRVRNLHNGRAVPPALGPTRGERGDFEGYRGADDRLDAIVGKYGYVTTDGDRLSVYLCYRSSFTKTKAMRRFEAMGGTIDQEGDWEFGGFAPPEAIVDVLKLIRVSRLRPEPAYIPWRQGPSTQSKTLAPESTQAAGEVVKVGAGAELAVPPTAVGRS